MSRDDMSESAPEVPSPASAPILEEKRPSITTTTTGPVMVASEAPRSITCMVPAHKKAEKVVKRTFLTRCSGTDWTRLPTEQKGTCACNLRVDGFSVGPSQDIECDRTANQDPRLTDSSYKDKLSSRCIQTDLSIPSYPPDEHSTSQSPSDIVYLTNLPDFLTVQDLLGMLASSQPIQLVSIHRTLYDHANAIVQFQPSLESNRGSQTGLVASFIAKWSQVKVKGRPLLVNATVNDHLVAQAELVKRPDYKQMRIASSAMPRAVRLSRLATPVTERRNRTVLISSERPVIHSSAPYSRDFLLCYDSNALNIDGWDSYQPVRAAKLPEPVNMADITREVLQILISELRSKAREDVNRAIVRPAVARVVKDFETAQEDLRARSRALAARSLPPREPSAIEPLPLHPRDNRPAQEQAAQRIPEVTVALPKSESNSSEEGLFQVKPRKPRKQAIMPPNKPTIKRPAPKPVVRRLQKESSSDSDSDFSSSRKTLGHSKAILTRSPSSSDEDSEDSPLLMKFEPIPSVTEIETPENKPKSVLPPKKKRKPAQPRKKLEKKLPEGSSPLPHRDSPLLSPTPFLPDPVDVVMKEPDSILAEFSQISPEEAQSLSHILKTASLQEGLDYGLDLSPEELLYASQLVNQNCMTLLTSAYPFY